MDKRFKLAIPEGYRVFDNQFDIAFAHDHKRAVAGLKGSNKETFRLKPEPSNPVDPNAMWVVVERKGIFGRRVSKLGYLPAEIAEWVAELGLAAEAVPRPKSVWIGDRGGLSLKMDILGPKSRYDDYKAWIQRKANAILQKYRAEPASPIQKAYYKFFGLKFVKGTTSGEADDHIAEHQELLSRSGDARARLWSAFESHWDELNDPDIREEFEIKKPSMSLAQKVFNQWINEDDFDVEEVDHIDVFVDKLTDEKPDLER